MTHTSDFFGTVCKHPGRLIMPFLVIAIAVCAYVAVRPNSWEASQALFVRNDAFNREDAPGEFRHSDEMKITQETILEIVQSYSVLHDALKQVGPSADRAASVMFPKPVDVEGLSKVVKLEPPKGAEFGTTEVFYLKVEDHDPERAKSLATAICDQLDSHFQRMRDAKARSMIDELIQTVELTKSESDDSTRRLAKLESEVGSDLAELRILHLAPSDASELRRRVVEMESELRTTQTTLRSDNELLKLLRAAQNDAGTLLATPTRLLDSQPALRRLKDGLIDAQLRAAELMGTRTKEHPLVKVAMAAEDEIRYHIHNELGVAIRGLEVEHRLTTARVDSLKQQLADARGRLEWIASLRASYSNLVAEVEHHNRLLEEARRDLTEARASLVGALATSLIDRLDAPVVGTKPVGPSRALLAIFGILGGLGTGGAVVFLSIPKPVLGGKAWGDGPHGVPTAKLPTATFAELTQQSSSSTKHAPNEATKTGVSFN